MRHDINEIINNLINGIEILFIPYNNQIKQATLTAFLVQLSMEDFEKEEFLNNLSECWDTINEGLEDEGN